MSIEDTALLLLAYLIVNAVSIGWVFLSKQNQIPRTFSRLLGIVVKIACVFAVFVGVGYSLLHLSALALVVVLGIALLLMLPESDGSDNVGPGIEVVAILFLWFPFYCLRQRILGLPIQSGLALPTPDVAAPPSEIADFTSKQAKVVSPLRPLGLVEIGGKTYEAQAENGQFIDAGDLVIVQSHSNRTLLVRVLSES